MDLTDPYSIAYRENMLDFNITIRETFTQKHRSSEYVRKITC